MINRFVARGMGKSDAELVVGKMAQYENFFVNLMVSEELGLQLPEDDDASLLTDAFMMVLSFAIIGILPILLYLAGYFITNINERLLYVIALGITGIMLFTLGAMKSCFSSVFWVYTGFEALLVGMSCAGVSYVIGSYMRSVII